MENIVLTSLTIPEVKKLFRNELENYFAEKESTVPTTNDVELLTRKEAAALLGISLPTLLEWTKSGIVTGYRISSRIRYKRSELQQALTKIKTSK